MFFYLAKIFYRWALKREVIKKGRIIHPILITEDGYIVDGAHRRDISIQTELLLPAIIIQGRYIEISSKEDKVKLKSWLD